MNRLGRESGRQWQSKPEKNVFVQSYSIHLVPIWVSEWSTSVATPAFKQVWQGTNETGEVSGGPCEVIPVCNALTSFHPSIQPIYGLELRSTCQHIGESRSLPPWLWAGPPGGSDKIQRHHAEEESGIRLKGNNYSNECGLFLFFFLDALASLRSKLRVTDWLTE